MEDPDIDLCNFSVHSEISLFTQTANNAATFQLYLDDFVTFGTQTLTFEITGKSYDAVDSFELSFDLVSPCEQVSMTIVPPLPPDDYFYFGTSEVVTEAIDIIPEECLMIY